MLDAAAEPRSCAALYIADRGVQAELPLPVAGPPLGRPLRGGRSGLRGGPSGRPATSAAPPRDPFQTLAFLALYVIPTLKITDRGLIDVDSFGIVPLA
jgi:adenine deaminase